MPLGCLRGGPWTKTDATPRGCDLPDLPGRGVGSGAADAGVRRVDRAVAGDRDVVEPGRALDADLSGGGARLRLNLRMTATDGSVGVVPPSRSARYRMPFEMSLPYGSFRTSGGVSRLRGSPGVLHADPARGVDRPVVVEERDPGVVGLDGLRTPRLGTTITPRAPSYEQLSAE
jgi:hypothetical protein